jgi:drug/metabolite transporter (DMT)-like permease
MGRRQPTPTRNPREQPLPDPFGPGTAVVILGLVSALAWGAGDFGGGSLARRAPLFGVVLGTQAIGIVVALMVGGVRGEPVPQGADILWSVASGICGVVGISALYRGLAVGRMGVVAPVTGVLGAAVPVLFGFVTEGVPGPLAIAGIVTALMAVVLVTRAPGHNSDHPTGLAWALLAGSAIGLFNICIGQLSPAGAFGPLVLIRLVQAIVLGVLILAWRQPWRVERRLWGPLVLIGVLDMTGNAAFIFATQAGQLAIASILSSLYPVVTVILAIAILRERLTPSHAVGVVLTGAAIIMIGMGSATL